MWDHWVNWDADRIRQAEHLIGTGVSSGLESPASSLFLTVFVGIDYTLLIIA